MSKLSKQNTSLRETIQRLDREKMLQEAKWKSHLKVTRRIRIRKESLCCQVGAAKTTVLDGREQLLQAENIQLKEEVRDVLEPHPDSYTDPESEPQPDPDPDSLDPDPEAEPAGAVPEEPAGEEPGAW